MFKSKTWFYSLAKKGLKMLKPFEVKWEQCGLVPQVKFGHGTARTVLGSGLVLFVVGLFASSVQKIPGAIVARVLMHSSNGNFLLKTKQDPQLSFRRKEKSSFIPVTGTVGIRIMDSPIFKTWTFS